MSKCIWKQYKREELEKIVKESVSYMEIAKKLGYSLGGSYTKSINTMIQYYGFDTSHFLGQGANKGKFKMENFTTNSKARTNNIRYSLINIRGNKCEICGLEEWNGKPITLELHHIDGDNTNHSLDNIQLLCPNCHSQTEGWRGRKS